MNSSLRQAFYALCTVFLAQLSFAQTDLLPTAITSPTNGCLLSAFENVEVRVARGDNSTAGSVGFSVTVTTTVNGTTYPTETSSISLFPYQAALISGSSAPIDFSAPGIYNIQCVISYGGTIAANDTIATSVISSVLPGALSPDETVCEGDNGQITLSGNSGEIVQWEESVDGGVNWSALGNTTNSLNYTNIAQTTSYRVLSQGEFDTLIQAGGDILGFETGQQSGWAVALDNSGTRVAIGEFETNGGEGSVRVLDYNGATWTQVGDTLRGSAVNRQFGFNVALSDDGNTLAVGIQRSDSIGADVGAAAIYSWDGSNWSEINMVFGSIQDSLFGRYMDLSDNGQFLVVGSPHNEVNGTNAGAVYSYSYQTDVPVRVQLGLDIDGEAASDLSGVSVSLSSDGSRMAIGASENDGNGSNAGHVRVYEWDGIGWVQLGLDIDGEAAFDQSGGSVSLSSDGSRMAIGARRNNGNGSSAGHVRVYEWDGIGWVQLGLDIDGEAAFDLSGGSVSLSSDGSRMAIGAAENDGNGSDAGHVRVYEWDGIGWVQLGLDIDGEAVGDRSGASFSLSSDGSRMAIGAVENDGNGSDAGHVRVYEWDGIGWVQLGLDIDGEAASDRSGGSVSLSSDGSRMAIGAVGNDGNGPGAGHVRVYEWDGIGWVQLGLDIDGEAASDQSGVSVSLSSDGSRMAIGAVGNDGNGPDAGHVRVYEWDGIGWVQLGLDIDGEAASDLSGWSVSLSSDGSRMAIGAVGNNGNGFLAGHVRVYELDSFTGFLTLNDTLYGNPGDHFGGSVAIDADGNRLAVGSPKWSDGVQDSVGRVDYYSRSVDVWNSLGSGVTSGRGMSEFGSDISLNAQGNRLVVGSYLDDLGGVNTGATMVYQRVGAGNWSQIGSDLRGEDFGDGAGIAVGIDNTGDRIVVGAPFNPGGGNFSGHMRMYELLGSNWVQVRPDLDGDAPNDFFGFGVAISGNGNFVASGSGSNDNAGADAGLTRVYEVNTLPSACGSAYSDTTTITVDAAVIAGNLSSDAVVCGGNNTGNLALTGVQGTVVNWELSVDGGLSWSPIVNVSQSYVYNNLTTTTQFRVIVTNGSCGNDTSNTVTITVDPPVIGGNLAGSATVCASGNNGSITLGGEVGTIIGWESSIDAGGTWTSLANTTNTQNYTDLVTTTWYRAEVQSGTCGNAYSDIAIVTVDDPVIAGNLSSDAVVCGGNNTGNLALTGVQGTVVNWELSVDGGLSWSPIVNVSQSYVYNNLTTTTQFRVIVTNGSCGNDTSNTVTITVDPPVIGGNLAGSATVCASGNNGSITLGGEVGTVIGWESSIDAGGTWTSLANTTNTQNYTDLVATTWYRAEVQSGTCGNAYSDIAIVTVDDPVIAGNLSSDAVVCGGNNTGNLALTGVQGTVVNWELSVDGGLSWSPIVNVSQSYVYNNLTTTTQFRVIVTNGSCGNDTSNTVTITVDPPVIGGNLAGSATVCASGNNGSITLGGEVGTIIGWESSIDAGGTWTSLANTTNTQNYTDLVTTTWYRAEVQSGACGNAYSNIAIITVDEVTNAGLLSADSTVCYLNNTGDLTLSGTVGSTVAWESNNGSGWTIVANAGTTYTYSGLLDTTQYRYIATNGACGNDTSNTVTINVDPNLPPDAGVVVVNNTLISDTTVCAGSNTDTLRLINMVGSVIHWEQSQDGGNTWLTVSNTDTFQVFLDLPTTTYYRALVQGGACGIGYSDTAIVRVDDISQGGLLAEDMVVCSGSNQDTLILSSYVGDIVSWEIDSGLGYQSLGVVNDSLIFFDLDTTTSYRVEVKNGVCPSVYSNDVTVSVTPTTVGGTLITGTSTVCEGDNSGTILLTNYVGNITRWEYSEDNGATWIPMIETADSITYLNILRETQYRVFVQASGCPDVYSSVLTMLVYEPSVAGLLASDAVVCDSVHSGTLTLTGSLGNSIVWQSVDTGAVNDSIQLGGTTYEYVNLTNTTRFIAIVTNGVCPPDSSNVVGVLTNFTEADFAFDNVCIGDEMYFTDETFIKDGFAVLRNWDFGNGTGATIEDPVVLFDEVGTYDVQLSIVSQGFCTDTIVKTVEVYPLPDSTITNLGDSAFCDGDSTILRGEDGLSYLWTTGDTTQFLTVTVEDFYGLTVTDSNLCVNASEVFIEVWPLPQAEAGNDTTISLGQTTILNGSGGEEYMWDPPTFLDDFMLQNPLSSPDSSIQYTVLVTDSNGCQNTDSVLITVLIDYLFTPSNLVTPNGDGFNDTWFVENLVDYPACEVLIFNEFGEIVFQEREYDNDWAGDFQGARLPDGTYYYVITCPDAAALYKGHVTILSQQ